MKRRIASVFLALAMLLSLVPGVAPIARADEDEEIQYDRWPEMRGYFSARYTVDGIQSSRALVGDVVQLELWINGIDPYSLTLPINWDPTVLTLINDRTGEDATSGLKTEKELGDGFRDGSACYDPSFDWDTWLPKYWNGKLVYSTPEEGGEGYPYLDVEHGHSRFLFYTNAATASAAPQLYFKMQFRVISGGNPNIHFATDAEAYFDPASAEGFELAFTDGGVVTCALELPALYVISSWEESTPAVEDPGIGYDGDVNQRPPEDEEEELPSQPGQGSGDSVVRLPETNMVPAQHLTQYFPYATPIYTQAVVKTAKGQTAQARDNYILPASSLAEAINQLFIHDASSIVVRMPNRLIDKDNYTVSFPCENLDDLAYRMAAMLYFETPYGFVGVNTAALLAMVGDDAEMTLETSSAAGGIQLAVQVDGKTVQGFAAPVFLILLPYTGGGEPKVESPDVFGSYYRSKVGAQPLSLSAYHAEANVVSFLTPSAGTFTIAQKSEKTFADVPATHWGHDAIATLSAAGVINGKTATEFDPGGTVLRSEMAKMITCACSTYQTDLTNRFTDVNAFSWYYPYVASANSLGIINGTSSTTFSPNDQLNRQDMAVMAYRALQLLGVPIPAKRPAPNFPDGSQISSYAREAVSALYSAGIINGTGDGSFAPLGKATRAEAAQVIGGVYALLQGLV